MKMFKACLPLEKINEEPVRGRISTDDSLMVHCSIRKKKRTTTHKMGVHEKRLENVALGSDIY